MDITNFLLCYFVFQRQYPMITMTKQTSLNKNIKNIPRSRNYNFSEPYMNIWKQDTKRGAYKQFLQNST